MEQNVPNLFACQTAGPGFDQNVVAQQVAVATLAAQRVAAETPVTGVNAVVADNFDAAKAVARLKAGEAALVAIKELVKKAVPSAYANLLDNEFVLAAMANAVAVALKQLKPGNAKVEAFANLLVEAAWVKIANKIDVEAILASITDKVDLSAL